MTKKFLEISLLPITLGLRTFNDVYYQRDSHWESNPHSSKYTNRPRYTIATCQNIRSHHNLTSENRHHSRYPECQVLLELNGHNRDIPQTKRCFLSFCKFSLPWLFKYPHKGESLLESHSSLGILCILDQELPPIKLGVQLQELDHW